ncbi:peptidase M23 [Corynebacterium bovis]|uniref:peptidoglycan DD-metalloendopeptidase family protein n=2 Tax=Corynebacterium bovis TaxID=36808 RepID=UPI000F652F0A|nr:peptidoglycan DD-metalloendopeptidase family protein [Corynebacterium bovis]RRO97039.1 peptidase M23 [Corynebacterium bovis]
MRARVVSVFLVVGLVVVLLVVIFGGGDDKCVAPGSEGSSAVVDGDFAYPAEKDKTTVTSGFGPREGGFHKGIDLAGPVGTKIFAFADGVVSAAADQGVSGFGGWVVIDHTIAGEPRSTVYGHMAPGGVHVHVGDHVTKGQHIADIGSAGQSSGPHLHFEITRGLRLAGGQQEDPAPWLAKIDAAADGGGGTQSQAGPAAAGPAGAPTGQGQVVPVSVSPDARATDARQVDNIRAIISRGKGRGASANEIKAAIMAAGQESGWRMLASRAVPESLNYPNDGVVAGDATSVGLFQIQVPMNMSVADGMNREKQIDWFFDTAAQLSDPGKQAWEIAADTERPREDLRGMYRRWEPAADELLASEGNIAPTGGDGCPPGGGSGGIPASATEFAKKAIEAARRQKGQAYVWGGGDAGGPTGGGFDCSGLTLYAYAQASDHQVVMDHFTGSDASPGQLHDPRLVDVPLDAIEPGDLLFFGTLSDTHHVGIAIDSQTMIHAPDFGQTVKEEPLSHFSDLVAARRIKEQ